MKKVIFASAAALCAVVGLSSYKADTRAALRYFNIPGTISTSVTSLTDNQVSYRQDTNPGDVCDGEDNLCVVSIETTYLTAGKQHIKPLVSAPIKTVISTKD